MKGVLDALDELIGRLPIHRFAVRLTAVTEHDPEDVRSASPSVGHNDRGARAEVDLGFIARLAFHPPKRRWRCPFETLDESLHAAVAAGEGMFIDQIYDVGRVENVHFWPFWNWSEPALQQWLAENGEAFIFGRTDWQYVLNTFCFGYRIGYRFIETANGVCNGNFLGIGADDCMEACVMVDQCAPYGLLITNGEFVSFRGDNPTMVVVNATHQGTVRFVNCACWGPNKQIARVAGTGTVGFSDCTFMQWDRDKEGRAAIQVESGTVLVRGCEFKGDGKQVSLAPQVRRAVIAENVFGGLPRIDNRSTGSVQIGLNAAVGERTPK